MRHPLNTLGRIFDFQLVAGESELFGNPCNRLNPEDTNEIILDGITVQAIPFLPHSRSSYVFLIGNVLFPGAILHAGTLGDTPSEYNEELLVATVKDYLFSIPHAERDVLLMPSVGPPSTIRAERHLSPYYRDRDSGV